MSSGESVARSNNSDVGGVRRNPAPEASPLDASRRDFLARSGALVVSFALFPHLSRAQRSDTPQGGPALGSLEKTPYLDSWIRIGADGAVTVFTGKAELGQGVMTALQQIAADQLAMPFERITLVTADTARTPNEGYTAGSNSMKDSGTAIMNASAQVRELLVGLAAQKWSLPVDQLVAKDGAVETKDGRHIEYGALVQDQLLHVTAQPQSRFLPRRTMGQPVQRVDIPRKVTGGIAYVQDLRLPNMLHARVVRPPSYAAQLKSLDESVATKLPGVVKVVRDGRFIAVVAEQEWQAIRAMRALSDSARWDVPAALTPPAAIYDRLLQLRSQDSVIAGDGNASAGAPSERVVEATYRRPYQIHGSIGPSCAVAQTKDGTLTVWTHCQGVFPLRGALAELVKMPADKVHCIHMEGSGCYGHNAADDVAADAALAAIAIGDKPVRVQWMREHEHAWEPFGPAMVMKARAALDAGGKVASWQYDVWSNTHSMRPGKAGHLLAATLLETPIPTPPPQPLPLPDGGGDRNAIPLYAFANTRVVHHFIPEMPLRVSALRALGAYGNVFAIESFVDELALAAKADPIEFRLRHLEDPRAREVIANVAARFGWPAFRRKDDGGVRTGRGFAFARYKNHAAYAAIAMDVRIERETGEAHVGRVVVAIDSGSAVNPDGIRNQVEGGVVQSLSWSLLEHVTWDASRITSRDWSGYPILRFTQLPQSIDVQVIDRPGEPFLGTGEAVQGPTAAALANAIADALGVRIRELPLDRARIKAAIGV
jgi:CO/xanthine dehydrogenase Mo-binding subunit